MIVEVKVFVPVKLCVLPRKATFDERRASASVPNTTEKAATLLMDAVSELTTWHAIRDAC